MCHLIKTFFKKLVFLSFFISVFCLVGYNGQSAASESTEKNDIKNIIEEELKVIDSLNRIDFALNSARNKIKKLKIKIDVIGLKVKKAYSLKKAIETEIEDKKDYASYRLSALYKCNNLKTSGFLSSLNSTYDFLNTAFFIKKIIAYDDKVLQSLFDKYIALDELLSDLNVKIENEKKLQSKLSENIKIAEKNKKLKQDLLKNISEKKSLQIAALKARQETSGRLNNRFSKISGLFSGSQNDRKLFSEHKGLLKMPVNGKIVLKFGPYKNRNLDIDGFSNGINIMTDKGEPVRAVFDGKIIFANWLKHYGNVLITDHGENYYTVYAHIQDIFKKEGDHVKKGEVMATAGDTGSFNGCRLHFEIRHHGKSIDPLIWLNQS